MEEIKSDSVSPEDGRTTDSTHGIGTPQAGEDKKGFDPESTGCATANGASQPSSEYSSGNGTSQSQPASRSRKIRVRKKKPPTSKYRGVCEERGKWRAQTSVHSKRCFLGTYDTEIEAALAYDAAMIFFNCSTHPNALNFPESSPIVIQELRKHPIDPESSASLAAKLRPVISAAARWMLPPQPVAPLRATPRSLAPADSFHLQISASSSFASPPVVPEAFHQAKGHVEDRAPGPLFRPIKGQSLTGGGDHDSSITNDMPPREPYARRPHDRYVHHDGLSYSVSTFNGRDGQRSRSPPSTAYPAEALRGRRPLAAEEITLAKAYDALQKEEEARHVEARRRQWMTDNYYRMAWQEPDSHYASASYDSRYEQYRRERWEEEQRYILAMEQYRGVPRAATSPDHDAALFHSSSQRYALPPTAPPPMPSPYVPWEPLPARFAAEEPSMASEREMLWRLYNDMESRKRRRI